MLRLAREHGFSEINYISNESDFMQIKTFFKALEENRFEEFEKGFFHNIFQQLNEIDAILFHMSIAKRQRNSYNLMKTNLSEDCIFIEMDYKQKVINFCN